MGGVCECVCVRQRERAVALALHKAAIVISSTLDRTFDKQTGPEHKQAEHRQFLSFQNDDRGSVSCVCVCVWQRLVFVVCNFRSKWGVWPCYSDNTHTQCGLTPVTLQQQNMSANTKRVSKRPTWPSACFTVTLFIFSFWLLCFYLPRNVGLYHLFCAP